MKHTIAFFLIFFYPCLWAEAQIYAPEIKVQGTNGGIGVGMMPHIAIALDVNGKIRIPAATNIENNSPGIVFSPQDDFIWDSKYLNHYGLGFYHPSAGGLIPYISGYYGLDFFSQATHRMRIAQDGKVGIGTQTPATKLDVRGQDVSLYSGTSNNSLHIGRNTGERFQIYVEDLDGRIDFFQDSDNNNRHPFYIRNLASGTHPDNDIRLYAGSGRLVVKPNGRVGINTLSPSETLHVAGNILASNFPTTSDRRIKRDIYEYNTGLGLINQINPVRFKYKPRKLKIVDLDTLQNTTKESVSWEEDNREYIGVIAQDIQKIAPDLVGSFINDDGEEVLTVNQTAFTYILINAVKEQQAMIENLESRITALEQKKSKK